MAAIALMGCGSSGSSPAGPGTATAAASAVSSVAPAPSTAAATARPTPTPRPSAAQRPTDLTTDGTCEEGHTCLGSLPAGSYREDVFQPPFTFSTTTEGWENIVHTGGSFDLDWLKHPGDVITFKRAPRATTAGGTLENLGKTTVETLGSWLAANPDVEVTAAQPITIGGLKGMTMDLTLSPTANHPGGDCPTQTCVGLFRGTDRATWEWDWGIANGERMRIYLLDGGEDVVMIAVDSLDGTTFDALTKEAAAILGSVKFEP
jgi:hypothetical protein